MDSEDEVTPLGVLIGPRLLKGGTEVKTSTLRGIVGVYFSAHWCGPCRSFTPQFRKVYERAKSKGRAFEVVFMSSDHDEQSFKEYFATMPWHAIPYAQRARYQHLNALFQIRGIPALVFLDAHTGGVLDTNARSRVMQPNFISTLPRSIDLDAAGLPDVGSGMPILVRYRGKEFELECEPSEGWEMLRMQIYSMTEVPSEQMKLFGLGLDTGPGSAMRTLWRGAGVIVARGSALSASQLMAYDEAKTKLKASGLGDGPLVHFTSSVIAAVVGTTCHMPFDVVLTMYQSAHSLGGERYNRYGRHGPLGCALALVQESGPSVLLRGWVPAFVRLVPVSVFSFALYEQLRQLFGIGYLD